MQIRFMRRQCSHGTLDRRLFGSFAGDAPGWLPRFATGALALLVVGCMADIEVDRAAEGRLSSEARLDRLAAGIAGDGTFADLTPPELQTAILASHRHGASGAAAIIDATGDRVFFPMPRERRTFESQDDVGALVAEHFGRTAESVDEAGIPTVRGRYVQRGATYFEDFEVGVRYRVTDPIAAFLGGVDGEVEIDGQLVCIAGPGGCEGPRASYLVPEGVLTADPVRTLCASNGSGVCVRFTAFFNQVPFPPWARHGSNADMYTHTALPSTQLFTGGFTFQLQIDPSDPFGNRDDLPVDSAVGEEFVESADWCFGGCPAYSANGVCGVGEVIDPDVNGVRGTGNGPQGAHCFSLPPTPW